MSRPAGGRSILSKPLAYPSTLDPRRGPTWRSFGARCVRFAKKCRQKQRSFRQLITAREAQRSLSLSGGASIPFQRFFKLSITLVRSIDFASKATKATLLGRPRSICYAARNLARTPPNEGVDITRQALAREPKRARHIRRGGGRFGQVFSHVDGEEHHLLVVVPRRSIDQTSAGRKRKVRRSR